MAKNHKPFPIFVRELEVSQVYDVTPQMRRVVLTGEQLGAFRADSGVEVTPFFTDGADDHVKIVILDPSDSSVRPPSQTEGTLEWTREALNRSRDYTPRRYDAQAKLLELDFVRHEGGLAAAWAEQVTVGDRIHVAGPRGTTVLPDGIDWFLLVGDETALPAIARRIEELPAGTPVTAVVSIPSATEIQELHHSADLDITWIAGDVSDSDAVMKALAAITWRQGQVYAWAAGETGFLRPIRQWLKNDRKVGKDFTDIAGYWRAGAGQTDAVRQLQELQEAANLAVPYALRAVVGLRLAEHIADGVTQLPALTAAADADERGVRKLIRLLRHEGFFTLNGDDEVALAPKGRLLLEERVQERLSEAGGFNQLDKAWPGLLHAVRTGTSGYEHVQGERFWETVARNEPQGESFDEGLATWSTLWAPAVAASLPLPSAASVVDIGGGSGTLLAEILDKHPDARGTLVELPTTAERARARFALQGVLDRVEVVSQSFFETIPSGADVYLLAQVLHDWPDAEAEAILRRAAQACGGAPLYLVERLSGPDTHDHDDEFDLQMYVVFNGGERTEREYAALAEAAGLSLVGKKAVTDELFLLELRAH